MDQEKTQIDSAGCANEQNPKYPLTPADEEMLDNRFTYHPPKPDQIPRYGSIRANAAAFSRHIMENCPPSRERSIALTHIEDAVMAANKAIAVNE